MRRGGGEGERGNEAAVSVGMGEGLRRRSRGGLRRRSAGPAGLWRGGAARRLRLRAGQGEERRPRGQGRCGGGRAKLHARRVERAPVEVDHVGVDGALDVLLALFAPAARGHASTRHRHMSEKEYQRRRRRRRAQGRGEGRAARTGLASVLNTLTCARTEQVCIKSASGRARSKARYTRPGRSANLGLRGRAARRQGGWELRGAAAIAPAAGRALARARSCRMRCAWRWLQRRGGGPRQGAHTFFSG
jgi:hypothetical protein